MEGLVNPNIQRPNARPPRGWAGGPEKDQKGDLLPRTVDTLPDPCAVEARGEGLDPMGPKKKDKKNP